MHEVYAFSLISFLYVRTIVDARLVGMKIVWDEVKRAKNLKKHGVDVKVAQLVFDDPH